jgi:DNA-binding beta-propeller fold protein YncE
MMAELDELLAEALRDLAAEVPGLPPLTSRSRRRIRAGRTGAILASVVIVAALCAGLVIGVRALNRATRPQPVSPPNSAHWTATVRARIPLPVSQSSDVAVLGSTAWVSDWYTGKVVRVDLTTRRVTKVLHIGGPRDGPISLAAGAGSVWVLDFSTGRVLRIAPATGRVISRIQVGGEAVDVAYGGGFVWVISGGHLYKIDPARDRIVRMAPIPGAAGPGCVAFPGSQGIWVGCGGVAGISLIDPRSLKAVRRSPVNPGEYSPQIAPGQRVVWVLTAHGLFRVDLATGRITAIVQTTWNPEASRIPAISVDSSGRVWVAGSSLTVLVPGSLTIRPVANTAEMGIISVIEAGPNLWADTGTTLLELGLNRSPARP